MSSKGCSSQEGLSSSHPRADAGMTAALAPVGSTCSVRHSGVGLPGELRWADCWWTAVLWTPGYLFSERLEVKREQREADRVRGQQLMPLALPQGP